MRFSALAVVVLLSASPALAEVGGRASVGWQGIGADKGLTVVVDSPLVLKERFGFFADVGGQETIGFPVGQTELFHLTYLLLHAGFVARGELLPQLEWCFRLGAGIHWPSRELDAEEMTPTITIRTGLAYLMAPSIGLMGYLEFGVEANVWNRAEGLIGRPFPGRGTIVQFGLRQRF